MDEDLKSQQSAEPPQPSEAEVVQALMEIDRASKDVQAASGALPAVSAAPPSPVISNARLVALFAVVFAVIALLAWGAQRAAKRFLSSTAGRTRGNGSVAISSISHPALQAEAEGLLARVAAGDVAAAEQVLSKSHSWTGMTQCTPKTDQLIGTCINLKDLQARAAGLQAQLALNGIPLDASGFKTLEQATANPSQRAWAVWLLGALGNRGVDPVHSAKVIESYLDDPDVSVRSNAVMGLALLGTDETIPMLLDRFRNDPSAAVQELAACGLAESGMYTHPQRIMAAATLVGWLDDSLLTQQQRTWTVQALQDISGQNIGADSKAWRQWLDANR